MVTDENLTQQKLGVCPTWLAQGVKRPFTGAVVLIFGEVLKKGES